MSHQVKYVHKYYFPGPMASALSQKPINKISTHGRIGGRAICECRKFKQKKISVSENKVGKYRDTFHAY